MIELENTKLTLERVLHVLTFLGLGCENKGI